ncbi:dihydrofolate reductase isoform X1 [Lingula anatina]|uniref:dihydrofolate reductase n=1 Tax=Lingula anatina TaxID=7574 RepID=A0A1S3HNN8_LINAN|nr:dihydrofolate reductase isoform X1 [Lingula anatina]|eukprot:XP_013387146.1 dihydrofolate reductase isoform X1 [Lingula anatina]
MPDVKLNLVVAMCNNRGIGINGQLPWRLRGDMNFFKKITSETKDPDKKNAVIMGRKTWFSIPEKFRPLANRINVVLSREMKDSPDGAHISRSLEDALSLLSTPPLSDKVESLFVIGGSAIYEMALKSPQCHRIYLTRVMADFECDTFLPDFAQDKFAMVRDPSVSSDMQTEKDINYQFEVYEKVD